MMTKLVEYCLAYLVGDADANLSPPIALLRKVVENTANLAASYMAAGFVHGVLNSDNINVNGESFDYGPRRFRSEEHTSELQSLMRISYVFFCLKKEKELY